MPNKTLQKALSWVAKNFSDDPSKMLIWTGVAGWTISSLAQILAILFNSKISNKEKSFLVPQEMADAAVNIASFFLITNVAKMAAAKLFKTGKIAPKTVREFLNKNKALYGDKVGKLDFNLDKVLQEGTDAYKSYNVYKSIGTTAATIGGGILAANIVTPLARNAMASKMQKNYINAKDADIQKTYTIQPSFKAYGHDMRI